MASPFFDAIKASVSSAPGTGPITIGAVSSGFRAFSNVPNNSIVDYRAESGSDWEIGFGLWNGTTLTRTLKYSSTGSLLSLGTNTTVSLIIPADRVQPHIGGGKWALISAVANSDQLSAIGTFVGQLGPINATTVDSTDYFTRQHRASVTCYNNPGSMGGIVATSALVFVSQDSFRGGFEFVARFGINLMEVNQNRLQVGLSQSLSGYTNPSDLTQCAVFAVGTGNSKILFTSNSNAGSALTIDTGITMVTHGFYECAVWCHPGERKLYWAIVRLDTGQSAYGIVTDGNKIPTNNATMTASIAMGIGNGTNSPIIDVQSLYLKSSF